MHCGRVGGLLLLFGVGDLNELYVAESFARQLRRAREFVHFLRFLKPLLFAYVLWSDREARDKSCGGQNKLRGELAQKRGAADAHEHAPQTEKQVHTQAGGDHRYVVGEFVDETRVVHPPREEERRLSVDEVAVEFVTQTECNAVAEVAVHEPSGEVHSAAQYAEYEPLENEIRLHLVNFWISGLLARLDFFWIWLLDLLVTVLV